MIEYNHLWELPYEDYLKEKKRIEDEDNKILLKQAKERAEAFVWAIKNNWGIKCGD